MTFRAGPHLTVAATPDKEVAVVMSYDEVKVSHVTLSPDAARQLGIDIIAAAARAELPPRLDQRFITNHSLPQDRAHIRWADEHDERL